MRREKTRYTYFIYDDEAACVDCETCNTKIVNLHGHTSEEVMARVLKHDNEVHGGDRP